MMESEAESWAFKLLTAVYQGAFHNSQHWSYERLNHSLQDALTMAISLNMRFDPDDIEKIYRRYAGRWWFGCEQERRIYTLACQSRNAGAADSYEQWVGRKPFPSPQKIKGSIQRLHEGALFEWEGMPVSVTSFGDDGSYVTAFSSDDASGKRRRFKITREAAIAERRRRTAEKKAAEEAEATK